MTEIGHDSHLNIFSGTMLWNNPSIHDRMYRVHVEAGTHSNNISTSELIILFCHRNTTKGAENDGGNTNIVWGYICISYIPTKRTITSL